MKNTVYSRKISAKESQEGYIFILKGKLNFFPKLGDKFKLVNGELIREVSVEEYPCTCRGLDLPHEHYFIRWEGLNVGNRIKIIKESEEEDKYRLQKE